MNEEYFRSSPEKPSHQQLTWVEWFEEYLGVQTYVSFSLENSKTWHNFAEYLRNKRPEKFLGALLVHYQHDPEPDGDFIQCVQNTELLCRGKHLVSMREAYFPTQELKGLVEQYVEPGAFFPWLWLDEEATYDAIPPQWREMLTKYGIGFAGNVDFALTMLQCSMGALPADADIAPSSRDRLFRLYDHIQSQYRAAENKLAARDKIRAVFKRKACIYIPPTEGHSRWTSLDNCVWAAPMKMKTKYVLRLLYIEECLPLDQTDFLYMEAFLTGTLGIRPCTWEIYVDELNELRRSESEDIDDITSIYKELRTIRWGPTTEGQKEAFRAAFDKDALIFVPSDDGASWHKSSQCVWSTAASLRGKVSLNRDYEGLEDLFVDFLGVKPVDIHMAIEELKEVGSRGGDVLVDEVKDSIWTVNSLLAMETKPPPPGDILKRRIFPIKHPGGDIQCYSKTTEFFIIDRDPLRRLFESKVKLLDFTLDEVVRLRPLLQWARLEDRYLSVHVKEATIFRGSGARPISSEGRNIRYKAHALLRIAVHFNSPRTTGHQDRVAFYEMLRNARMYETDGVISSLLLAQDGNPHVVECKTTGLHFEEDGTDLKIFVPAEKDDQDYTLSKALPERLFQWLMTHPRSNITEEASENGVAATKDIILTPRSRIVMALEDCGIRTVDIPNVDEEFGRDSTSPERVTNMARAGDEGYQGSLTGHGQEDADSVPGNLDTPASSVLPSQQVSEADSGRERPLESQESPQTSSGPPVSYSQSSVLPIRSVQSQIPQDSTYLALLNMVIAAGRKDKFPKHGDSSRALLREDESTPSSVTDIQIRAANQFERDCKIGAAGELYVFELLSHLNPKLPSFARQNWQSNMRKHVTIHPEYANMTDWKGSEISDIIYEDTNGVLTNFLVLGNYLDRDKWSGKNPKYLIEVKATQQSLDAPFYMTKAQYSRMQKNVLDSENTHTIYVIFRVYNLGRANRPLGLHLFLDPETLKLAGKLEFKAHSWSVAPRDI